PIAKNPYELFYLSDQRGITNLFSYSFLDSTFHQITNFDRTVQDYDLHFNDDRMLYLLLERGAEQVYLNKEMDLDQNRFSPQTARQRMLQAQYVTEIYNRRQLKAKQEEKKEKRETEALPKVDTMLTGSNEPGIDPEDFRFEGEPENDLIDTDNYRFSDKVNTNQFRPESFFTNYQRLELDEKIIGPIPYIPQFSFNQLTTSFAVDPIRGIGLVLETQISDVLGNHKLKGGGFVVRDLSQGDIYAEYDFLKYWMDLKLRIDRKSYFFEGNGEDENNLRQRNNLSKISIGASVPLSNWFRIEFNPFYAQTEFRNLHYSAVINRAPNDYAPNEKLGYAGFEARSVFDNTIDKGFNMIQGTRASLEFIKYQNLQTVEKSFGNIRFDLRHYQPVYKSLTLATRIFYGQFVGQNPQKYMLGGIPNWLGFYRTHPHPSNDPLAPDNSVNLGHVLFSEFVYNLRGFQYNEKYGASSFLVNTELRVPVFQLMSKAPPTSNFLRNFVIVPFFDMGSAWTGLPPIKAENSENTIVYKPKNPSFSAEISNFRNPWLSSYGIGMRTVLLDYYIKIDYSRPILDMKYLNSRITLSVGLDF
ncbi:MAG: hypothetical protein OEY56_13575, partial [Cyclobacteriaceae bacterium]|nr:hypothetical protein [Cyclobacteriaceae bacterium]